MTDDQQPPDQSPEARRTDMIEGKIRPDVTSAIAVGAAMGGVRVENMAQVFEIAKLMAISGPAVPKHLRGNPGACFSVALQATEWNMTSFTVANKTYVVNDRMGYESQLITALILTRAPIADYPEYTFTGEGPTLRCKVAIKMKNGRVLEYESPAVGAIKVKNSPLWVSDTEQQLCYYSMRAWARRHQPNVIMGIYTPEELQELPPEQTGPETAKDVSPSLVERIRTAPKEGQQGFDRAGIDKALGAQDTATTIEVDGDGVITGIRIEEHAAASPVASAAADGVTAQTVPAATRKSRKKAHGETASDLLNRADSGNQNAASDHPAVAPEGGGEGPAESAGDGGGGDPGVASGERSEDQGGG